MKSAVMDTPVTEPTVISTMLGGIVSDIAPEAESRPIKSPSLVPRLLHFRKERRRHRGHVGGLGAGNARDEVHGA